MIGRKMLLRLAVFALAAGGSGCGALDVSDPMAIEDDDIRNAQGADLVRRDVLVKFQTAFSTLARESAQFTDEYLVDPDQETVDNGYWVGMTATDRRSATLQGDETYYGLWQAMRVGGTRAIEWLQAYVTPEAAKNRIGQMYVLRGYNLLFLAETFCPGFPLDEVREGRVVYGTPVSANELFQRALVDLDSALVYGADTSEVLHLAQVAKARALLGLGRFAEAAAAAAPVPLDFEAPLIHTGSGGDDNHLSLTQSVLAIDRESVADREGGTGLDFVSAEDPRLPLLLKGTATDGVTQMYGPAKYANNATPVILANGIEARLIEAEAALASGDPTWLPILNALRAEHEELALSILLDPGTEEARVDMLFRERAFWLFATGHRLGDLRRLIRLYDRDPATVFPTGAYRIGGATYGPLTSLPFPMTAAANHPDVTGCTGS